MYHYVDSGLENVFLANGYDHIETPYGEGVAIDDLDGLHVVIGKTIADSPTMTGDEFRFLRIELGLAQADAAKLIGVGESVLRNWEKGRTKRVTRPAANLMRGLYLQSVDTTSRLSELLYRISHLNMDIHHERMCLEQTENGWMLNWADGTENV